MKNPVKAAAGCAASSDDPPGSCRFPPGNRLRAWDPRRPCVRFSAASAPQGIGFCGHCFCPVFLFPLAVSGVCCLRRRPAVGILGRRIGKRFPVGKHCRTASPAGIPGILAVLFPYFRLSRITPEEIFSKNLYFLQKTICIWTKIGYNRMEYVSACRTEQRRTPPW